MYYFTDRRTVSFGPALSQQPGTLLELLRREGVEYVIHGRLHHGEYNLLVYLLEPECQALALEAAFEPYTYVLRVLEPGVAMDGAAYAAIAARRQAESPRGAADET